mgnify:CR=1 FL=1|jgi:hypothetical protein
MGIFGKKTKNELPLDFFVLESGKVRLNDDAFRLLSSLVENTRGISPSLAIKGHAAVGHLSESQLESFGKEVFRDTYDCVLSAVKKSQTGDLGIGSDDFPLTTDEKDFYARINSWIGKQSEDTTARDVLTIGYLGAAFDVMNHTKPRMNLGSRLVSEGCFQVAAMTLGSLFP